MITDIRFVDVRRAYEALNPDGHWFDEGSMRFFRTKLPEIAFRAISGAMYFITSEVSPSGVKAYTVRCLTLQGKIDTVGDFHSHPTRKHAMKALKEASHG